MLFLAYRALSVCAWCATLVTLSIGIADKREPVEYRGVVIRGAKGRHSAGRMARSYSEPRYAGWSACLHLVRCLRTRVRVTADLPAGVGTAAGGCLTPRRCFDSVSAESPFVQDFHREQASYDVLIEARVTCVGWSAGRLAARLELRRHRLVMASAQRAGYSLAIAALPGAACTQYPRARGIRSAPKRRAALKGWILARSLKFGRRMSEADRVSHRSVALELRIAISMYVQPRSGYPQRGEPGMRSTDASSRAATYESGLGSSRTTFCSSVSVAWRPTKVSMC